MAQSSLDILGYGGISGLTWGRLREDACGRGVHLPVAWTACVVEAGIGCFQAMECYQSTLPFCGRGRARCQGPAGEAVVKVAMSVARARRALKVLCRAEGR
jgi:hypothetical protein